jgi:multiple sugar transport system ATP-binding protein
MPRCSAGTPCRIAGQLASVVFDRVGKVYGDGTRAVLDLSLEVDDGEFIVLVGPSGCGKTSALMMAAGLEEITEGEIRIDGRVINDLEPRERDIAMVFQNYALYPHMSVYENLAFGLQMKKTPKPEIDRRVRELAAVLGLQHLLKRRPRQLSGGQRQRVAMGRAIVRNPSAFLMDEPLSNLDAKLRVQMRAEISRIQRELGATTIYVTHDQVEAMTMGDRVAVMRKGRLQQLDVPQRLYDAPVNLFVASFIGSPEMNLVQGRLEPVDGELVCRIGEQRFPLAAEVVAAHPGLDRHAGATIAIGIRPEHLHYPALGAACDGPRLRGTVQLTEALGPELLVYVEVDGERVRTAEVLEVAGDIDEAVAEEIRDEAARGTTMFVARFDARSAVRIGDVVEMAIDVDRLHFFDLTTELALFENASSGSPRRAA